MARSLEQTQNENHKNITVTSVDFRATPKSSWSWYTSREFCGVEGNVEDDNIENERPIFVSPTDGVLDEDILECLHAQIPLNDFPANYGINDYVAAVQLITLSTDTI